MPEYEFFVSSGAPQPANKAIRSHAMRTALQLRGRTTRDQQQGSAASQRTRDLKDGLKGRFRVSEKPSGREANKQARKRAQSGIVAGGSAELKASEAALVLLLAGDGMGGVEWFGNSVVDPFGAIPVPSNWRVEILVKYFLTRFSLNISTVDKQRPWFSYAMSEPLIMNVTLALSAAYWSAGTCWTSNIIKDEGTYQKVEAIKGINAMLQESNVTDTVIAAVANLGNIAAIEGSFEEADMHVRGLQKLLQLRGGVDSFRDIFYIARAINWVDVQVASGLGRKPLFPLIHGMEEVNLPESIATEAELPPLPCLGDLGDKEETIISIFTSLRQALLCRKHRIAAPNGIRIILNIAECQILDSLADENQTPQDHRFRTLLLAAHVFLYAGLRQLPPMGPLIQLLLDRLKKALGAGEVNADAWKDHLSDLLWVLFIGAAASPKDRYGRGLWFCSRLELVLRLVRIESQAALENILRQYLWADEYGCEFLRKFWDDVASGSTERIPRLLANIEAACNAR